MAPAQSMETYPWPRIPRLATQISLGKPETAHTLLDQLLDEFDAEHDPALGPRKLRCAALMSHCLRGAHRGGARSEPTLTLFMAGLNALSGKRSWPAVRRYLHDYLSGLLALVEPQQRTTIDRLVDRICDDLRRGREFDTSLAAYAHRARVNPDYLSRRFKQVVGHGYSDAKRQHRLRHTTRLLSGTQLKISAITHRLGLKDVSQFIADFKSQTGTTPHEYRKMRRA